MISKTVPMPIYRVIPKLSGSKIAILTPFELPGSLSMHIGMIVGIGPAATDYYYRYLTRHKLLAFPIPTSSAMHARLRLELRACQ
jgi:hypothetical protein